jgi:glucan 1,3-beta-glucosidase
MVFDFYNLENASGWIFWTFKAEKSPQWSYMQGVKEGWIPKDLNQRRYRC